MNTETLPSLHDLGYAIERVKEVQLRVSRHKATFHEGKHANDLQIINVMLTQVLDALTGQS